MASQRPGAMPGIRTVRMARCALPPRAGKGTGEWSEMKCRDTGLRFSDVDSCEGFKESVNFT